MTASPPRPSTPFLGSFSLGLAQRILLFALLFTAEWIPIADRVRQGRGLVSLIQLTIVFGAFFLGMLYVRGKNILELSGPLQAAPLRLPFFFAHVATFLATILLAFLPFESGSLLQRSCLAVLCCAMALASMGLAFCALLPPRIAWPLIRRTGYAWAYAAISGLVVWRLMRSFSLGSAIVWDPAVGLSWKPVTDLTFGVVHSVLRLFLTQVVADRATMTLGSPSFNVTILPGCAGLEGTALMLVFSAAWLWFLRTEFRFPAAFSLIPAAMLVIWMSNAVRIAALILIGVAGFPEIAVGGFHSQAGWIAFNSVALTFAMVSRRLPWMASASSGKAAAQASRDEGSNPSFAYLMPFCAILAASMLSRAASSDFEWLYPVRFVAAAGVLWVFRKQYALLDWRTGWFSLAAGAAAFVIWLGLAPTAEAHSTSANALAKMPDAARTAWLVVRTAAAVVTVPIAEELAFRCFLIRRLMSRDFESLSPRAYSVAAVVISSLAFGLLQEDDWLPGVCAGFVYAFAFLRRGSTGDAVAAHATTNALLAGWVIAGSKWTIW